VTGLCDGAYLPGTGTALFTNLGAGRKSGYDLDQVPTCPQDDPLRQSAGHRRGYARRARDDDRDESGFCHRYSFKFPRSPLVETALTVMRQLGADIFTGRKQFL
jgi:hypothetical protein